MTTQPTPTHRITTYFDRGGKPGLTQASSLRLSSLQAINWILTHLPDGTYRVDEADGIVTIRLDLASLVPADEATTRSRT